jgi:hypothetical protein
MPQTPKPPQTQAMECKTKNVIDMALTFSAMLRVFSSHSKAKITGRMEELLTRLQHVKDKQEYELGHTGWCEWFTEAICTAEKKLKNGQIKPSWPCSYGQAAKILDVSAKVYFHYCRQPTVNVSATIVPMLHCAVDTEILKHLARLPGATIKSKQLSAVDGNEYRKLQALVLQDIKGNFGSAVLPVEYDDIMWRRLSRDQPKDDPEA